MDFFACSYVIHRRKGILKLILVVGIFVDGVEAGSCIIRINFCIINAESGQKGILHGHSHVIQRWKDILKLISVMGIFEDEVEAESCIVRNKFCIINA